MFGMLYCSYTRNFTPVHAIRNPYPLEFKLRTLKLSITGVVPAKKKLSLALSAYFIQFNLSNRLYKICEGFEIICRRV